jgi:hypothetical protein
MFVAVVLVCVQTIVQDMRDCTVGTAIQIIRLEQLFFTEEECLNRGSLVGRVMLLHEMKPEDEMKVLCEHRRSDNN